MDLQRFSSSDSKLRCFICKNYLSYFPIFLCTNNQSICGRCAIPGGFNASRNEAFEVISESFRFSCRYKSEGCPEELLPKEVPKHELNCSFRMVPCIIRNPKQCEWKGSLFTLSQHHRQKHSELVLNEDWFLMDLSVSGECDYLLDYEGTFLIFTKKFDLKKSTLYCAIYNNKYDANNTNCSVILSLKNGKKTLSIDIETTKFERVIFTQLCVRCLRDECDKEKKILAKVCTKNQEVNGEKYLVGCEEINSALLSAVKCSICSEFCLYHVYRDPLKMKVYCLDCSEADPSWHRDKYVWDVNLSTVSHLLAHPCKYRNNGCMFSCNWRQMQIHQFNCEYAVTECVHNEFRLCEWTGLKKDVKDHILSNHQDLFFILSKDELELTKEDAKCNFFKFSTCIFRLVYCVEENSHCLWSVQKIGHCPEELKYEIDITDDRKSGRRLLMRQHCSEFSAKEVVFRDLSSCCYFEKKQIESFVQSQGQS